MGGVENAKAAMPGIAPSSRTWRMPFAKSSAPPRALSPASPSTVNSNNHTSTGSSPRRKASTSNKTFRLSATPQTQDNDGSFVETTSEKAAQALAKYWNDVQAQAEAHGKQGLARVAANGGSDYVVVARVENGKRIYKIRYVHLKATVYLGYPAKSPSLHAGLVPVHPPWQSGKKGTCS